MFNRKDLKNFSKILKLSVMGLALVGATSVGRAEITNAYAYGYTATVDCYSHFTDATDWLRLTIHQTGDGQLGGYINTDTVLDPTLTLQHVINNDTGIAWNSYHVSVFMPNFFTIGGAVVNIPGGWSAVVTAPTPVLGGFQGQVDYSGGPVIAPGGVLDFQLAITFANGLAFSFTEDVSPGLVPEPSTAALLLGGLLAFGLKRSRKTA
jgi:PEP-CTERM motif-containing protein